MTKSAADRQLAFAQNRYETTAFTPSCPGWRTIKNCFVRETRKHVRMSAPTIVLQHLVFEIVRRARCATKVRRRCGRLVRCRNDGQPRKLESCHEGHQERLGRENAPFQAGKRRLSILCTCDAQTRGTCDAQTRGRIGSAGCSASWKMKNPQAITF